MTSKLSKSTPECPYFLEQLNNIQSINVFVDKILLPAPVNTRGVSLTPSEHGAEIKLPLIRSKYTNNNHLLSEVQIPLNAMELKGVSTIKCGFCKHQLTKKNNLFQKTLDLPSEHWLELADCWMCHQDDYQQVQKGEISARSGTLLVGNTYLLVSSEDIEANTIITEERDSEKLKSFKFKKWHSVICSRCLSTLGEGLLDNNEENLVSVRLKKYEVILNSAQEKIIPKPSFLSFIIADLLEISKSSASYHFIIEEKAQKTPLLQIWVFSWNTAVSSNARLNVSVEDDSVKELEQYPLTTVLKVLYNDISDPQNMDSQRLFDKWKNNKQVETLSYPSDHCLELLLSLRLSTLSLPPVKRKMNSFSVGYLPISSEL
ncbi:E3 ubiquitin-protein ligase E3D [Basidiobolus ranarum]|uniref:E3 ubiquitin-protein ligase E3D n=1 Tax=Basidiobolus ranarum TaxID=34480 RepID=A0ABR2WFI8_9FUNG